MMKSYPHDEIQKAAVSAMPKLLRAGKLAVDKGQAQGRDESYVKQLSDDIISSLVKAMNKEPETEILVDMLSSLNECIRIAGSSLESELVKKFFDEFKQVITEERELLQEDISEECFYQFSVKFKKYYFNQDLVKKIGLIGECLGMVLKLLKSTILPHFDEIISFITPMLGKDRTVEERRFAICIFYDVAREKCFAATEYSPKHFGTFVPFLLEACTDENAYVRQAAVYGIGLCAKRGDAKMKSLVGETLSRLKSDINYPSFFHFPNRRATDNAISELGKIHEHQGDCIDASQVVPAWLSRLPIEAKVLHEPLCSLLEDLILDFLDERISIWQEINVGDVNRHCVLALVLQQKTISKIVRLLSQLQQTMPPPPLASTWSSLQPQQQAALQSIL